MPRYGNDDDTGRVRAFYSYRKLRVLAKAKAEQMKLKSRVKKKRGPGRPRKDLN
jgi:hypothetical protein